MGLNWVLREKRTQKTGLDGGHWFAVATPKGKSRKEKQKGLNWVLVLVSSQVYLGLVSLSLGSVPQFLKIYHRVRHVAGGGLLWLMPPGPGQTLRWVGCRSCCCQLVFDQSGDREAARPICWRNSSARWLVLVSPGLKWHSIQPWVKMTVDTVNPGLKFKP